MNRETRDSGIEWIGQIPKDWKTPKVKYHALLFNGDRGKNYPGDNDLKSEGVPFITSNNLHGLILNTDSSISKFITDECYNRLGGAKIQLNDIIFCLRGSVGICAINKELQQGTVASSLMDVRPVKINADFLNYFFHSELANVQTTAYMNGSCAANLSAEAVSNYYLLLPNNTEQQKIVSFLDRKCSVIDIAIKKTKESIGKLEEYKNAIVTKVVFKGLILDTQTRDSGTEWLGEVPDNWKIKRIGSIYAETNERGNDTLPILTVSINTGISDKEIAEEENTRKILRSEDKSKYKRMEPGDIVYNMMRAWQGAFGAARIEGMVSPAYVTARPIIEVDSRYFEYLFRTDRAAEEFKRYSRGIADFRLRLYWPEFKTIKVCVPPLEEQREIADYLDNLYKSVEEAQKKYQETIEKLEEYRKSIIYHAVTGKIDCREVSE